MDHLNLKLQGEIREIWPLKYLIFRVPLLSAKAAVYIELPARRKEDAAMYMELADMFREDAAIYMEVVAAVCRQAATTFWVKATCDMEHAARYKEQEVWWREQNAVEPATNMEVAGTFRDLAATYRTNATNYREQAARYKEQEAWYREQLARYKKQNTVDPSAVPDRNRRRQAYLQLLKSLIRRLRQQKIEKKRRVVSTPQKFISGQEKSKRSRGASESPTEDQPLNQLIE